MNLNKMIQNSLPTRISIIIRLRASNSKNTNEKNNSENLENNLYTMFTINKQSPTDILYISEQPIDSTKINELLNLNNQNHTLNFLNFNKIYPDSVPLDLIYQQILQNPINDLFYKKNSCMFFFGPTIGGKSYLLRGSPFKDENESGLLTRAINDIFQRLQFNSFIVKISVYQIFLDKIFDLLSNDNNMELNIEVNYSEMHNSCNINILGLNKKEIKTSDEYDLTLREAINNRRKLSQILGITDIKKKSHFIISVFLESISDNDNNNVEYMPFSQFDFVELVSSNYGLLNENEENLNIDKTIFDNTKDVFNSIAENIICLSHNSYCDNDSLLTLALKNTLKPKSNIIFANCVSPWEFPLKDSYTSLKFSNMLFNNIYKSENNSNSNLLNNINCTNNNSGNNITYILENNSENNINVNQNNIFNNINNLDKKKNLNDYLNSLTIDKMDYLFPEKDYTKNNNNSIQERDYKNEITKENNLFTKYNKINTNKNNNINNNKKPSKKNTYNKNNNNIFNKSYDNDKKIIKKKKLNNNYNYDNNSYKPQRNKNNTNFDKKKRVSSKEKKLQKLNEELKELEAKSNELNQNSLDPEYLYNFNNLDNNNLNTYNYTNTMYNDDKIKTIPGINQNPNNNSNTNIQYEKIKEEYGELKSNNIILKEDISRLEQANKNLESSLNEQRNRNLEILNQNEELSNRILKLEELLDEANIRDEKYKINEINIEKLLNEKLFLNAKINEDEKNYKMLKEEKEKYEIEYKVLNAKYVELKNNYDMIYNDYNNIKLNEDEKFNKIEDKIDNLLKEIEKLQSENNILRNENERQRIDINNIGIQRDEFKEKFNEEKNKNNLLCVKINEIENEFNNLRKEKMNEDYIKLKYEENKKNKNENKMKIVNELQNRIQKYREQRLRQDIDDD